MNPKRKPIVGSVVIVLCLMLASNVTAQSDSPEAAAVAVPAAFTYQGQIKRNGALFTGTCDMQFKLWDAAVGGTQQGTTLSPNGVSVANGVFAVELNFGNYFTGQAVWVEASVKCANDAGFTTLPRVALNAVPYAIGLMPGATISGDIPYAYGNATFKATNASASGGTALFGHATAASGNTAGVFGLSNSSGGAGIWGRNDGGVGVLGESSSTAGVKGTSATNVGVVGVSGPWVGVYGESSTYTGVEGKSTLGTGVAGSSTDYYGVYGESANHDGVHGVSHEPNKSGVAGITDAAGGIGVFGSAPLGSFAMRADGDASQGLSDGGWIKAMIHVDYRLPANIRITKCFNSQASGTAVTFPPCGFSVSGVQNGYWDVDFGFDVSGRFIQATVWNPNEGYCFISNCETRVIELRTTGGTNGVGVTISYNQSGNQTNAPFTLIVY